MTQPAWSEAKQTTSRAAARGRAWHPDGIAFNRPAGIGVSAKPGATLPAATRSGAARSAAVRERSWSPPFAAPQAAVHGSG